MKKVSKWMYETSVFILFFFAAIGFLQSLVLATWYGWLRAALTIKQPEKLREGFTLDAIHNNQLPAFGFALVIAIVAYSGRFFFYRVRKKEDIKLI